MMVNPEQGTVEDVANHILSLGESEKNEPEIEEAPEDLEEDQDNPEDEGEELDDDPIDESDEEEESEEEVEEEELYVVKVNGEEFEVTLDELRNGYMMERDYRRKTSEVAEQRKAIEEEQKRIADLNNVRQQYLQELEVLAQTNSQPLYTEEQLEKVLQEKGTDAYLKAKHAQDKRQKQLDIVRQQIGHVKNELTEEQKKEHAAMLQREREALSKAMPELLEEDNKRKLVEYLTKDMGFSPDDITNTADHRLFVIAEQARRYRELTAKKPVPKKKVPKVHKGKSVRKDQASHKQKQLNDLKKRANATGNVRDIAKLIEASS